MSRMFLYITTSGTCEGCPMKEGGMCNHDFWKRGREELFHHLIPIFPVWPIPVAPCCIVHHLREHRMDHVINSTRPTISAITA